MWVIVRDLPPFQRVKDDWRAIHQFLITWHCLVMGWIGDIYHFSYWETPPLLPKLLPDLLHPDFPPEIAQAFIDHYCRSYRAVAAERPAWGPELALQLAVPLAALPDPVWAIEQVGQAIQNWLTLRGLPPVAGTGVAVLDGFCAQVGGADGPVGPAVLVDPDFLAGLRDAIGSLSRSDLVERLGAAANAAAERQEREQMEREHQERQQQERAHQRRLEQEHRRVLADRWTALVPEDIHGWSTERVQQLQRSVAESLGLGPVFRDPLKDGSEGPKMVLIPPGSFLMGAPESDNEAEACEKPQHRVSIARPFAIGRYAVTFDEYDRFSAATGRENPSDKDWGRARRPVINVSWNDSVAYCAWLSEQTGRYYRLPTEAEWEYAARAGTATRWSFGKEQHVLANHAWFGGHSGSKTHPVGEKRPNPWGLYDIHGNVEEWTQDGWQKNYDDAPSDGTLFRESCASVGGAGVRGGSWAHVACEVRVSRRFGYGINCRPAVLGFRLAQDI